MSIQNTNLPNNPNIEVIKAKETGLFTNYIFKAIPLAFDESMSYYETLCGLLSYLKDTILPTVNNNANAVSELQNLYVELKTYVDDYFTNLDVQEEINNKLDQMVEDGTFNTLIEKYFNFLNETNSANTNLFIPIGMTTFFDNQSIDTINNQIINIKKYYSSLKQQVSLKWDIDSYKFVPYAENLNDQINVINDYINDGYNFDGLHFYIRGELNNLKELFDTYGTTRICNSLYNEILDIINNLPYKEKVNNIWILNEPINTSMTAEYKDDIINIIDNLKNLGYKISIAYANAYAITDTNQDILNSLDFISLNLYPFNDIYGKNTSINDMKERFNKEYRIIERYLQNKELWISECGCSASWDSFSNPPLYKNDKNGKPISIFIEGFYQSNFINVIKAFNIWYYVDAYMYSPYTLLSIKNKREVRYNG